MPEIVTVYATFGSEEEARFVARTLVEEGLAACANILPPCRSIYRWRGEVEEADEIAVLFKSAAARGGAVLDRIAALHSYDVPAAVVWPIADALAPYRSWVEEETSAGEATPTEAP